MNYQFIPRCRQGEPWFTSLLAARGIATDEARDRFLRPSLDDLHDPFLLDGMDQTVSLLRSAIGRGETILVYGDYDADGVCATSILLDLLHEEGASLAYRIPSRHEEGYGLNEQAVREMADKCSLLITVDCGISNYDEVALAKSLGLTVIVTDHHQPPETLPPADVVMDPLLGSYPFRSLCGAGVALKICQAMQGIEGVRKRLDIAAIATVADVVPLLDENRVIVREGMKCLEASARPALRALLRAAGTEPPLKADHLAFRLAPRLNAVGRLGDAKLSVHLLLTPDAAKADYIAAEDRLFTLENNLELKKISDAKSQSLSYLDLTDLGQQIEKAKQKLAELSGGEENQILAKVSGTVQSVECTAGETKAKGDALATIEVPDMGYTLSFTVTNDQARRLKVGDTATVSNYYWGKQITATLESIRVDPKNPQTNKLLTFNVDGDVNVGAELTISVGQKSANYDLIVPNSAVRSDANGSFVLKIEAKSSPLGNRYIARRVNVEVLAEDDMNSAVTGDLSNWGDFVITTSNAPVKSGDMVRLADNG